MVMQGMKRLEGTISKDANKRARMLFLAGVLSLSLFVMRALNIWVTGSPIELLYKGLAYLGLTYVGLIWALRFMVNWRSLLVVLPQSALFVASHVLFVETFFFRQFERVLDFFVLFVVWIGMLLLVYMSFLMTNLFNVGMYKELPLRQVAITSSYIVTLISVYLFSFGLLSLQWGFLPTLLVLCVIYAGVLIGHFYHMRMSDRSLTNIVLMVLIGMAASVVSGMFIGTRHEIIALMPTAVAFSMIGIVMQKNDGEELSFWLQVEYFAVFTVVLVINVLFS